jgi:hypothetical protein
MEDSNMSKDKITDDLDKVKSADKQRSKETEQSSKEIEIKITLTETGYRIDPPLDAGFLRSVLDGIREDLFIQELFARDDAPYMRKIEKPRRVK